MNSNKTTRRKNYFMEKLLVATGRKNFLEELGVETLGVITSSSFLKTDENQKVVDGVWAVGDIAGDGLFTHLAIRQAKVAAANILGNETGALNLDTLSAVTFTDPEVGNVGHTESSAQKSGIDIKVGVGFTCQAMRGSSNLLPIKIGAY